MPDETKTPGKPAFDIPEPKIEPLTLSVGDSLSTSEATAFSTGSESELRRKHWDWRLRVAFRVSLFLFVVAINGWWSYEITRILWHSGYSGSNSNFHLNDSVLIALVTTSIANFLALVIIVARHLFPTDPSK
jgi:hypothetical protein